MLEWFTLGKFIVALVFATGAQWAFYRFEIRELRKDLNGVGERCRQVESKLVFTAVTLSPEDKKQEIIEGLTRRHN